MTQDVSVRDVLPPGLSDRLPPLAASSLRTTHALLKSFMGFGYEPVIPSMMEYAETMLAGVSPEGQQAYFQLQDTVSNRVLALRADMTGQIARIAQTSLNSAPRPLRLCYAGPRVRATPEALHTRREHMQIGIEYIGADDMAAEAEVIALAEKSLNAIGLTHLTLDVHLPVLARASIAQLPAASQKQAMRAAKRKDKAALKALNADLLVDLLDVRGSLSEVAALLKGHKQAIMYAATQLEELEKALTAKGCTLQVQVDALELEHTASYTGISFSIFSRDPAFEVARGGRYHLNEHEQAVGFTLYLDDVIAHLNPEQPAAYVAVTHEITVTQALEIQAQGYRTVYVNELDKGELARAGITHQFVQGKVTTV